MLNQTVEFYTNSSDFNSMGVENETDPDVVALVS